MHNAIQFPTGHRSSQLTLRCHNSSIEFGVSSSCEDPNETHLLHRHMGSCTTQQSLEGGRDSSFGSEAPCHDESGKCEYSACLRSGRPLRVPRARASARGKKFVTPDVMISKRPVEVESRCVSGHWEGDLIIGLGKLCDWDARGTQDAFYHAVASAPHGRARSSTGEERASTGRPWGRGGQKSYHCCHAAAAARAAQVPDMGPGCRDGPTSSIKERYRDANLLLRAA